MVYVLFSDANTSNFFSGGSLLPGHTVSSTKGFLKLLIQQYLMIIIFSIGRIDSLWAVS